MTTWPFLEDRVTLQATLDFWMCMSACGFMLEAKKQALWYSQSSYSSVFFYNPTLQQGHLSFIKQISLNIYEVPGTFFFFATGGTVINKNKVLRLMVLTFQGRWIIVE